MKTAIFNLGGDPPGQARVELIKKTYTVILGYHLWKIRVLEIIRPSSVGVSCKNGQIKTISARWLEVE
jgi:hypothetical protein